MHKKMAFFCHFEMHILFGPADRRSAVPLPTEQIRASYGYAQSYILQLGRTRSFGDQTVFLQKLSQFLTKRSEILLQNS